MNDATQDGMEYILARESATPRFDGDFDEVLERERTEHPHMIAANKSPLQRQQHGALRNQEMFSEEERKKLRLANSVRLGCITDAHDSSPDEIVKEAAIQLKLLLGKRDWPLRTSQYGYIHYYVNTIAFFMKIDSTADVEAEEACFKTMEYIGPVWEELKAMKLPPFNLAEEFNTFLQKDKEWEAVEGITERCEEIMRLAHAEGTLCRKRNRDAYEKDFV